MWEIWANHWCRRLWRIAQSPKNRQVWSHWSICISEGGNTTIVPTYVVSHFIKAILNPTYFIEILLICGQIILYYWSPEIFVTMMFQMESVVEKMELTLFDWPPLAFVRYWVTPEIARGAEMVHGLLLPLLCFLFLPAYRQFCNEPDPDDLRLSSPKGIFLLVLMCCFIC